MQLLALDAAYTSAVYCDAVRLASSEIVAGPVPQVLGRRSPIRRLSVSATGLGLVAGIGDCISALEESGPSGLPPFAGEVERRRAAFARRLAALAAEENAEKEDIDTLRADMNALLVNLAGVLMTVAKGSGYLRGRTAQRLAREALFFCVWSAQDPVRQATIDRLLGPGG